MEKNVVHVVGTGTIGEPLIGLMASFREKLGIDEITFHKRTPLVTDRSKIAALSRHGVKLAVDKDCWQRFKELDMEPCYEAEQAIERAKVVIDCTPVGTKRNITTGMRIMAPALLLRAANLASVRCMRTASTTQPWTGKTIGLSKLSVATHITWPR